MITATVCHTNGNNIRNFNSETMLTVTHKTTIITYMRGTNMSIVMQCRRWLHATSLDAEEDEEETKRKSEGRMIFVFVDLK